MVFPLYFCPPLLKAGEIFEMSAKPFLSFLLIGAILLALTSRQGFADDSPEPTPPDPALIQTAFPKKEKMVFVLRWLGIKAGTISIHIHQKENGKWFILGEARSSPFFSIFFPVEDRFETEVGEDLYPEWITLQQHEGSYRAFRRVTFQQDRLRVISKKDDDPPKTYNLNRPAHNELTSFLILRTLPLKVGRSVFVEVFASNKTYTVEVKVLKKESLPTILGEVETFQIEPVLPFKTVKEQKGRFHAWFTDDQRRVPVKLKGGLILGSIVGELVEWEAEDTLLYRSLEAPPLSNSEVRRRPIGSGE
jgi:hypothetical protein